MKTNKTSSKETKSSVFPTQSRRAFLRAGALTMAAASLSSCATKDHKACCAAAPHIGNVKGANDKINIACIGVGGKGEEDVGDLLELLDKENLNIVGLCDVDQKSLDKMAVKLPKAKLFKDFRTMLTEMESSIDAVTVTIPDHNHAIATMIALNMGKHVFCQKPLTQTVWEARQVRNLAKAKNLATQMGNQGSQSAALRHAVEVVHAGVIGNVSELHIWSDRPVWPQGVTRPSIAEPWPATLDWDLWIGPAPMRPYANEWPKEILTEEYSYSKGVYHPFAWRAWYDFGCGALGDMACHTANMPARALKLGYPTVVEMEESSQLFPESYPKTSRIRFEFPEREGMVPLKFWWYDGNPHDKSLKMLRPPPDLTKDTWEVAPPENGKPPHLPDSGALLVGDKGMLFSPDDYGEESYLMLKGEKEYVELQNHPAAKAVPPTIPRSPGHKQEWFRMMRGGLPAYSNFDIAAYLTEIILLGCVALRIGPNKKMEWDGPNMISPSHPEAAQFVRRINRRGWDV